MEGLKLTAKAVVKITKLDENGQVIGIEEHETNLTEEEARALWPSLQQA